MIFLLLIFVLPESKNGSDMWLSVSFISRVLSLPIESLNDKTLELKELACLIGGTTSITSGDLAEFCKQNQNR